MRKADLIVVDMDGVLADFFGRALEVIGRACPDIEPWTRENWPKGEHDLAAFYDISKTAFWEIIQQELNFWASLDKLPWADELLPLCRMHSDRVVVMTSPSMDARCFGQKYKWLREKLNVAHKDIIIGGAKELLAAPNRILIDDREKACDKFIRAGGYAILFPHEQNCRHAQVGDPLRFIRHVLDIHGKLPEETTVSCDK